MSPKQYQKESAEQKEKGFFPLALASYGDDAKARYTAIWVRGRFAPLAIRAPGGPDPKAG